MPCDIVRLPCGSMSTHSTRWPSSTKAAARLGVVVVLATPPFWLAKAMTLALPVTSCSDHGRVNPSALPVRARERVSCRLRLVAQEPQVFRQQLRVQLLERDADALDAALVDQHHVGGVLEAPAGPVPRAPAEPEVAA